MVELATDERGKNVMRLITSASEIGRAILAPPGIPADRANALREAFTQMVKDPEFIANRHGATSMWSRSRRQTS